MSAAAAGAAAGVVVDAAAGTTADLFDPVPVTARERVPPARAEPPVAQPAPQAALPVPRQLWLALRLPLLPLDALWPRGESAPSSVHPSRPPTGTTPRAVVEGAGAQRRIVACDELATRQGLRPGLKLGAAYALVPELDVRERDPALELRYLQALGRWAIRYTPFVSLEPPDTLLLEVRGSLRLFGGAAALVARASRELAARGWRNVTALAPTPRAATWLSRAAPGTLVESEALLASRLGALAPGCTGWPERVHEALVRLGVRTLGELRRLPRDGLARRFEPQVLAELDEAFGLVPTPRRRHASPERFQERVDLAAELEQVEHLEPAFDRLFERMGRFLRVRNAGVERIVVAFTHRDSKPTCLALGRATPCGEPREWRLLLRERLGRETLRAPVLAIALRTSVALPLETESEALPGLDTERVQANAWTLLDRLRARLGDDAVNGVCLVPEHRPEAAWRRVKPRPATASAMSKRAGPAVKVGDAVRQNDAPAGDVESSGRGSAAGGTKPRRASSSAAGKPSSAAGKPSSQAKLEKLPPQAYAHVLAPRPLWLLAAPQRLRVQQGQPCYGGMLRFESGPERIESGWWDGRDVVRDYYVAVTREGVRLWVYREFGAQARGEFAAQARAESRWFLHGLFG